MPHKALLPVLLILFTLSIETHAAGKTKPANPVKTLCEFALVDRAQEEFDYDGIFSSAYLIMGALDEDGLKRAKIEKDVTDEALLEFFEQKDLEKAKSKKLHVRSQFTDKQDSVVPEVEVYIPGETADKDQVLSIVTGLYEKAILYWRKLDGSNGKILEHLPESAEVGLISPPIKESNAIRRFISVKESSVLATIVVGIDVPCNKLSEFTSKTQPPAKIVSAFGDFCRVPVFNFKIVLKNMNGGYGGGIGNIRL